jgi:hypothetical protein
MSFQKFSQVLSGKISDQMVATMVANSLRHEHQNDTSVVKEIGLITDANLHTINKWCQAINAPKSAHLLMLAAAYPQVLKSLLEMIGRGDVWQHCLTENIPSKMSPKPGGGRGGNGIYRDKFVPINVIVDLEMAIKMNGRQLWFMGELQRGRRLKAEDIAKQWWVTDKTAKRDISALIEYGAIRYNGARKNGFYTVT